MTSIRSKVLWSVMILLDAMLIGVILFIALAPDPKPNEEYQDYYVRYDGFYSEEIEGYVFFYSDTFRMYYKTENQLFPVEADFPFTLYYKTGDIEHPYARATSELIGTIYRDIDDNYYISVKDIDSVEIHPEKIYGGEYDNR